MELVKDKDKDKDKLKLLNYLIQKIKLTHNFIKIFKQIMI